MRILVTGAGGFIGRALGGALEARGIAWRGAARAEVGDIGAQTDWRRLMEGCDRVVHLANLAHAGAVSEAEIRAVNVEGTRRLAQQAADAGVRRLVYVSSVKAQEASDAYARAKRDAERALSAVRGVEVVVLRPPLVYGPGVKANFLALMRAIDRGWPLPFSSVVNRRSLVFTGNLSDAILCCLDAPQAAGKVYAVTDGASVSTPGLVHALARALGRPARLFAFPPKVLDLFPLLRPLTHSLEVDDSAIRRELGWRPPYSFEQGLRATAEWYLAQGR
ncbi:MAG TPA: NAD-dependent epimerase/dehydratase family protein [Burkholderiales bacterium]|nr:NAD-dependent epimerase/dehydratase family protein [Burkholderiales bacterium]